MSKQIILSRAVVNGDKDKILDLLQVDIDLTAKDNKGDTLLHLAFKNGNDSQAQLIEILEIFLDRGCDINVKNKLGKTILHLAVERRMRDVIAFCLKRNANPNLKNKRWNSIAHFVVEEECRKLHSREGNTNSELLENESSSFVDWMVSQGIDFFYTRNIQDYSALYLANHLNLQHIVLTLLKRISDLPPAEKGQTPLLCAFLEKMNDVPDSNNKILNPIHPYHYTFRYVNSIVKIILEKSPSVDDKSLAKALRKAIVNGLEINVIESILQRITSVDHRHDYGETLMTTFTSKFLKWTSEDCIKLLRIFIMKGADLNKRDRHGETIAQKLFRRHSKLQMLKLLVEGGADFGASTDPLESCLHFIGHHGNEAGMIDLVMNDSCDVNARDSRGETPLQLAVAYANELVAMDLMELGARVSDVYEDGRSMLTVACTMGQARVAEMLIEYRADLGYSDKRGKTLMHLAVDSPPVIELLVKNGLDVNATDNMGKTPLHYATNAAAIEALFRSGAFVDVQDTQGNSPLYYAVSQKSTVTMQVLLMCGANVRDPKVFALALEHFKNPYNIDFYKFRYIKRHLVELAAVGLLDEIPYAPKGIELELQKFYEQCQAEVALLDAFRVDDCTSLYKLLLKNRNRRCAYVDNEKLKALVDDVDIDKKFRNYFVLIMGCYNEAVTRKPLLESAVCILNEVVGKTLPDLCSDRIFMRLSNRDLMRFVEASKKCKCGYFSELI